MTKFLMFISVVFASCAGRVTGNLRIDGEPFAASTCRDGLSSGFPGVELADDRGRRLRLAQNLEGTLASVYFPPGSGLGENLGACGGTLEMHRGGRLPLYGNARLACRSERHQLSGWASFENCN